MRIGELATRVGVSTRALRYYEEQNLLSAERSPSGQRHYPDSAVDRVRLIRQLYDTGLPSRTIAELLPCIENSEVTTELLDRLTAEQTRIERQIADLKQTRDRLAAAIATATSAREAGHACPR